MVTNNVISGAPIKMNIQWFKQKLANNNLTQRQLALKLGMRIPFISELLKSKRGLNFEEAYQMAQLLNCSLKELYFAYKNKSFDDYPSTSTDIQEQGMLLAYQELLKAKEELKQKHILLTPEQEVHFLIKHYSILKTDS